MKISCISLNSNLLSTKSQDKVVEFLKSKLYEIGEKVSSISYFENSLEQIKNQNIENYDLVFIIGTISSIYNHNIKDNLSRLFGDKLSTNDTCTKNLNKYCVTNNIVFSMQEEMETLIPSRAIPLSQEEFYNNGFMYKQNNTYVIFLPSDIEFVKINFISYILPLIHDISNISQETITLKCFGVLEKDIKSMNHDLFDDKNIEVLITSDDIDSAIHIRFSSELDKEYIQNIISELCNRLNKYIYATEDISIYQMACDLLSLRGKHLVLGETITYGNINKKLSVIDNQAIQEAYIFNNYDAIIKQIGIDKKILDKFGHYSVNTVYELANAMLEKSKSQIAIFVLGDKNADVCYMAIGDLNGIHVYKNKINHKNNNVISNLSKTAMFYLIKKLKANDLLM